MKPNFLVILIDDLRYDEFGAGGHPYMQTPHIDRLAHEGALFERAFHTTPICSPNRASIVTGQYASRHGIIDNVARDAMSHRLPNYHLELQRLGLRDRAHRQVAHGQRRHAAARATTLGQLRRPRQAERPAAEPRRQVRAAQRLHHRHHERARGRVSRSASAAKPWSLFFAHKAVHPDAEQAADGTLRISAQGGYVVAERHKDLVPRRCLPEEAEHAAARRGDEAASRRGPTASR